MATLDPDSPRRRGRDAHGVPRELGDIDTDGYLVGWIAADGSCWESRREHEIAIASGRYLDAWLRWNRTGAALGTEPDPARFVTRYCSTDCEDERCASAPMRSSSCDSGSPTAREPPSATDRVAAVSCARLGAGVELTLRACGRVPVGQAHPGLRPGAARP